MAYHECQLNKQVVVGWLRWPQFSPPEYVACHVGNHGISYATSPLIICTMYIPHHLKACLRSMSMAHSRYLSFTVLQYLELARTLKYYGYIQFRECVCDYPTPDSKVTVSAGQRELNLRIDAPGGEIKERSFKVTRMKCWRITTHNVRFYHSIEVTQN